MFGGENFPLRHNPAFQRLMRGLMGAPEPVDVLAQRRAERRPVSVEEADAAVQAADALGAAQAGGTG
jgi:hypothetical protein